MRCAKLNLQSFKIEFDLRCLYNMKFIYNIVKAIVFFFEPDSIDEFLVMDCFFEKLPF